MKIFDETVKKCIRCGKCCFNKQINLIPKEVKEICEYLKIPVEKFLEDYCDVKYLHHEIPIPAICLKNRSDGSCIFLEGNLCKIHPVKPWQCKAYPFIIPKKKMKCVAGIEFKAKLYDVIKEKEKRNKELMEYYMELYEWLKSGRDIKEYFIEKVKKGRL